MVDREVALEALGVLCNAEITVVDESSGSLDSQFNSSLTLGDVVDGPGGAQTSGGAKTFSIHHLIPRVLDAHQGSFTGQQLQGTDEPDSFNAEYIRKDKTTGQMKLKIAIDEKQFFDPGYDFDFTSLKYTNTYYRGNEEYKRPYGYTRFALKVLGKYEDNTWLGYVGRGTKSVTGEWPVSYHGTKENCVDPIIKGHLKAGGGAVYGRGVYSTPHISEAESYATVFTSKKDGKKYRAILQNRINPAYRVICQRKEYWLIKVPEGTSDEKEEELVNRAIRPYGLLIKQL